MNRRFRRAPFWSRLWSALVGLCVEVSRAPQLTPQQRAERDRVRNKAKSSL